MGHENIPCLGGFVKGDEGERRGTKGNEDVEMFIGSDRGFPGYDGRSRREDGRGC